MPTISIVTPFSGETGHLLADFYQAVEHIDQLIIVDNACPHATATALVELTTHLNGEYIRNEQNQGFAAANNQGYSQAGGDIIIFLNSDVAPAGPWLEQVAHDVRDGALYGPSLASQLVAGRHIPYLEGWCVAATRGTWEGIVNALVLPVAKGNVDEVDLAQVREDIREHFGTGRAPVVLSSQDIKAEMIAPSQNTAPLVSTAEMLMRAGAIGPWDAPSYPGPYWEDNDLCLRALQQGIALIQTAWPIHHKGGQTAGPIIRHAESFARNERTFTERVLQVLKEPAMTPLWQRYMAAYHTPSDINHHIGLLYSLAKGNVVELGTRTGVSTAALLAGVEARGGRVWSVDLQDCSGLFDCELWTFIQSDSRNPELPLQVETPISLLLIDSEHVADVTTAELALWEPHVKEGGHILLHDPETFPGVRRAIENYCAARENLRVTYILPNNGMALIEKLPEHVLGRHGLGSVINGSVVFAGIAGET